MTQPPGSPSARHHLASSAYTTIALSAPTTTRFRNPLQAKLEAKAPFNQYTNVSGLNVAWGKPTDPSTYPSGKFDVIYDNNGKDMESCKALIDTAKVRCGKCQNVSKAAAVS